MTLPRTHLDQIVAHALEGRPHEVCGILGGQNGRVEALYRARNVAQNPRTRFTMDPRDILAITDQMEEAGLELIGFYHSHTHTRAYPSPTDVADWPARWYPDARCFICSLMEEDRPHLCAFHIHDDGSIEEEPIAIQE